MPRLFAMIPAMIPMLGVLAAPAAAQSPECFCLRHPSGNMLYGCEARVERYICEDDRGRITMLPVRSEWRLVACGCTRSSVEWPPPPNWRAGRPRSEEDGTQDNGDGKHSR
jgi:hypothetical protein